jgi:hypothetical protein
MLRVFSKKKTTVLIGVEGDNDQLFFEHIKDLYYLIEHSTFHPAIFNTRGGSPIMSVRKTIRKRNDGDFDKAYTVVDSDRHGDIEDAKKLAAIENIKLILLAPLCLDGMLLNSLNEKIPQTSMQCKSKLERICGKNPFSANSLGKNFPKPVLDKRRKSVQSLSQLIDLFTGSS